MHFFSKNINESSYTVNNLEHDTVYTVRVAAVTKSDSGESIPMVTRSGEYRQETNGNEVQYFSH